MKKKLYYISLFIFLILCINNIVVAQFTSTEVVYSDSLSSVLIAKQQKISAFSISSNQNITVAAPYCVVNLDTIHLQSNEEADNSIMYSSNLVVFDSPISNFSLYFNGLKDSVIINLLYVPTLENVTTQTLKSDCNSPAIVPQSIWREGLPEPQYERIYSNVENIIIHHSAGSNTATNYTDVVRNIYIYHTETNGWSDIGYNYVIAQDGTIYAGRDPGSYAQDEVQGAHFCGNNKNTMGICVLGNYESVDVPSKAFTSLYSLLAWKCSKNDLYPLSTHAHVLNSELGVIAGHRDGCSTACPGINLYEKLSDIRDETSLSMTQCNESYTSTNLIEKEIPFQINKQSISLLIDCDVSIHNLDGTLLLKNSFCTNEDITKNTLPKGILILSVNDVLYKILN